MLTTYEKERKPHAQFVVENSAGIGELMEAYAEAEDPNNVPADLVAKGYGSFVLPNLDKGLFYGGKANTSMGAGQLFPQPVIYKNDEVIMREDKILGNGFALISKNEILMNKQDKKFLEGLGCNFVVLEDRFTENSHWLKKIMELDKVYLIRPDKYIYGCTTNKVSLEELIEDLRLRI